MSTNPMNNRRERGSVLMVALIMVVVIIGITGAYLMPSLSKHRASVSSIDRTRAKSQAESGVSAAINDLNTGGTGNLGSVGAPVVFGGGQYYVTTTDNADGTYTIDSIGTVNGHIAGVKTAVAPAVGSLFEFALYGDEFVNLDSNASADSYDSALGTYDSQVSGKYQGKPFSLTNGNTGSNGQIHLNSSARIFGNATPGPSSAVKLDTNTYVSGTTTPAGAPRTLPPITLPAGYTSFGNAGLGSDVSLKNKAAPVLAPGNYYFSSFTLFTNTSLTIKGPATVVLDYFESKSNTTVTIDASGGPVTIYATGTFEMDSNTTFSSITGKPTDLFVYVTTDNVLEPKKQVRFASNSYLQGAFYAPKAYVSVNSGAGIHGAIVGRGIDLDSNAKFHYDEALGRIKIPITGKYRVVSWQKTR
ncbi:hypothetical protein JYT84_00880 [bacterium AH-315-M10]|nr:hypothetical protein [bacterium AH-315-M10]